MTHEIEYQISTTLFTVSLHKSHSYTRARNAYGATWPGLLDVAACAAALRAVKSRVEAQSAQMAML